MNKITNQICFEKFAEKLGITVVHGWKKALSGRLKQKNQTIISTWITRGVPEEFDRILRKAGIDPALWSEILENVRKLPGETPSQGEMKTQNKTEGGNDSMEGWKRYALKLEKDLAEAEEELIILRGIKKNHSVNGD